jgi:hypothetical protein
LTELFFSITIKKIKVWEGWPVKVLFTFENVSAALDCELFCTELEIPCRIIPAPRALSASCVYALIVETGDLSGLKESLRHKGAEYVRVFRGASPPEGGETWEPLTDPEDIPGGLKKNETEI